MYSPHKHSYLQLRTSGINPRLINRSVQLAREQYVVDAFDASPPFLRLSSEQPNIPIKKVDVTRRPLGFGRVAMRLLRRQLHNTDPIIVSQAIITICDLVRDPEKGFEAIDLRIPARMTDLIVNENPAIRERTCMALTAIACLADGKDAIVKNYHLLVNLVHAVDDVDAAVRIKAASCLEMCSRNWMSADYLVDHNFIEILIDCIYKDDINIIAIHLETLYNLMYGVTGIEEGIANGGFQAFVQLLNSDLPEITVGALKCIQRLLTYCEGKREGYNLNVLKKVNPFLYHENPHVYSAAASVIMLSTILTACKIQAYEIKDLAKRLIKLAHDNYLPSAQMFSLKALANLSDHPKIREYLQEEIRYIKDIVVGDDEEVKRYKEMLLECINWIP